MGPRLSIVAGLLAGVAVAAVLLAGVVALAPDPAAPTPSLPAPSIAASSPGPIDTASLPVASAPSSAPSASSASSGAQGSPFHVGEPAPPLVVPQVGGGSIDLAALRGKPVWVNFMATWCPPCQDEFPLMNGFAAQYADDDLIVIAIDVKEEEGVVAAFAQSLSTTFPLGLDSDGQAADRWGALALPVHFWIDADGIVRDGSLGGIGPDIMAKGLQAILPGVDVKP